MIEKPGRAEVAIEQFGLLERGFGINLSTEGLANACPSYTEAR
jgi:hypothetical protein